MMVPETVAFKGVCDCGTGVSSVVPVDGKVFNRAWCPVCRAPLNLLQDPPPPRLADSSRHYPHVDLCPNADGTWTAQIGEDTYIGTREKCLAWLRSEERFWDPRPQDGAERDAASKPMH